MLLGYVVTSEVSEGPAVVSFGYSQTTVQEWDPLRQRADQTG